MTLPEPLKKRVEELAQEIKYCGCGSTSYDKNGEAEDINYNRRSFKLGAEALWDELEPVIRGALEKIMEVSGTSCEHYHIAKEALKEFEDGEK